LTRNLYEFKKYSSRKILAKFLRINSKKEKLDTLLKDMENRKHRPKASKWQA